MDAPPHTAGLTAIVPSGERGAQAALLRSLRVGEVLQALVTSRPDPGTVTLSIKGTSVTAHTGVDLQPGQLLRLRVDTVSPVVHLRMAPPAPPPSNETLNAALREALPRQAQLAAVVSGLENGLQALQRERAQPAAQSIQALLAALPGRAQLRTAGGVREAFMNSGLFMEAKLANAPPHAPRPLPVAADLKALLARIVASLSAHRSTPAGDSAWVEQSAPRSAPRREGGIERAVSPERRPERGSATAAEGRAQRTLTPSPEGRVERAYAPATRGRADRAPVPAADVRESLVRQAESGLYRIQVQQLSSIADAQPGHGLWRAEVPVATERGVETLKLRIESEASADPAIGVVWSVTLDLESLDLGPLLAHLSFAQGRVSTRFWAERADTLSLISASVEELRAAFVEAGLEVGAIACSGEKPDPDAAPSARRSIIEAEA